MPVIRSARQLAGFVCPPSGQCLASQQGGWLGNITLRVQELVGPNFARKL